MASKDPKPLPAFFAKNIERFWAKVDKTPGQGPTGECWKFTGYCNQDGYGVLQIRRKNVLRMLRSNRVAYFLSTGRDPWPFDVLHRCDWPPCCNIDHLFIGTQIDNIQDMIERERHQRGDTHWSRRCPEKMARGDRSGARLHPEKYVRGEQSPNALLTSDKVRQIRLLRKGGWSRHKVANHFGVSEWAIKDIDNSKTWKHVS